MLRSRTHSDLWILLPFVLAGCNEQVLCGDGINDHTITGLSGTLEDGTLAVEVLLREPSCARLDSTWMFFDAETEALEIGEEPTSGTLDRSGLAVEDRSIFFERANIGVRLEYSGADIGPDLALVWFFADTDLFRVACSGSEASLECIIE